MQDINKTGSILFVVGKSPMDIMELILAFLQPTTVDKEPIKSTIYKDFSFSATHYSCKERKKTSDK